MRRRLRNGRDRCEACGAWNTLSEIVLENVVATRRPAPRQLGRQGRCAEGDRAEGSCARRRRACPPASANSTACSAAASPKARWCWSAAIRASASRRCRCRRYADDAIAAGLYVTGEESLAQVAAAHARLSIDGCMRWPKQRAHPRTRRRCARPRLIVADSVGDAVTEAGPRRRVRCRRCARAPRAWCGYAKETQRRCSRRPRDREYRRPRVPAIRSMRCCISRATRVRGFRAARCSRNRFGAVNELGASPRWAIRGLREVPNPSAIFLSAAPRRQPGSCVMVTREGTRPLLVEVQALVDSSPLSNPRRVAVGVEQNRSWRCCWRCCTARRRSASLTRTCSVNVVGGIRVQETAADLPVLLWR